MHLKHHRGTHHFDHCTRSPLTSLLLNRNPFPQPSPPRHAWPRSLRIQQRLIGGTFKARNWGRDWRERGRIRVRGSWKEVDQLRNRRRGAWGMSQGLLEGFRQGRLRGLRISHCSCSRPWRCSRYTRLSIRQLIMICRI